MKKSILIVLFMVLGFFVFASYALEVNLLGPKQYLRTTGRPNIYNDNFPGRFGQGMLIVKNGDANEDHRISSAIIKINGIQIFGANDFNQNVQLMERTVDLQEENSISIELRSKPGSYLTIDIRQKIAADAAAVIGMGGGTVEVGDTASPIFGTAVYFPEGAVDTASIFTISRSSRDPGVPLPNNLEPDGPMILFETKARLLKPVLATFMFSGERVEDELRGVFRFDETTQTWELVAPVPTTDSSKLKAILWHFSGYIKGKGVNNINSKYSGFNIDNDSLRVTNTKDTATKMGGCAFDIFNGGICSGMSLIAELFFNYYASQYNEGLHCYWGDKKSWDTACKAQGLFWIDVCEYVVRILRSTGILSTLVTLFDDSYLADFLILRLSANLTSSLTMIDLSLFTSHTILVVGWEKTGPFSGKFIVYDSRDNAHYDEINYVRTGVWPFIYTRFDYYNYDTFDATSTFITNYRPFSQLIESTRREYPCPVPEIVFKSDFDDGTLQGWGTIDYSCLSSERAYSGNYSIKVNDILAGGNEAEVYRIFQPGVSKGRAELVMYIPSGNSAGISIFLSDRTYWEKYPSTRFQIYFETNGQVYWNQGGWHQYSNRPIAFNTWNKVILSWDCATNEMTLNINGYDYGRAYNNNPGGSITQLTFQGMCWICTGIYAWFDDIKVVKY